VDDYKHLLRPRVRRLDSCRTSPTSSMLGDELTSPLTRAESTTFAARPRRPSSIQMVGRAIARNTTCFWLKSKSSPDADRYAYGMPEEANDSVSEPAKSKLSTSTKGYEIRCRDIKPRLRDTSYNWLSNRLNNRLNNRLHRVNIQPVVQPVWQPVVSCKRGLREL